MGTMSNQRSSQLIIYTEKLRTQLLIGEQRYQRTLDDQVGSQDGHATDTDTSFGSSIGSSKAGENDG